MANNSQSRKWTLVINNPIEAGLDHTAITALLALFSPVYYCLADEIATTGTFHTHIYIYSSSPIRFTTLKNRYPTAHIEKAYGSSKENRDYITKSGKWVKTDKAETMIEGSFMEWGELPAEKEEAYPEMYRIMQDIHEGKRTAEIIQQSPKYAFKVRDIDILRQTLLAERFTIENREVEVTYLYGDTGAGKTRSIFERHNPWEICRITNYRKGVSFDAYNGQDVLVFEEFHSQIPIGDMLNYLDIYPLTLPARYTDRIACYTKVYITSNLPLLAQYREEQCRRRKNWEAFMRRIHNVVRFQKNEMIVERSN